MYTCYADLTMYCPTISADVLKGKGKGATCTVVSTPDPPCTRKKKRKISAEERLVQLIQNNLQSAEFQRVESDWLIGN